MDGADIGDVTLESGCDVIARAQRERETLCEAGRRDALAQQVRQLVQSKLVGDAARRRRTSLHVVVAVRDRDVLDDVTRVDHVVSHRRDLKPQTHHAHFHTSS